MRGNYSWKLGNSFPLTPGPLPVAEGRKRVRDHARRVAPSWDWQVAMTDC